jgi:hypothetical protein
MNEEKTEPKTKEIYKAIIGVTEDLIKEGGIGKTRMNEQQKFRFRGIEDIQNTLAPLLVRHRLCIVPTFAGRKTDQYESKTGGKIFSTVVEGVFDLISAIDGSSVRVTIPGEAMDTGDKSTNKAMSMAMKYAAILTFCIPTEGEDADAGTHEVRGDGKTDSKENGGPPNGPSPKPVGTPAGEVDSKKSSSDPGSPSPAVKRLLTKVVQINGRRLRTAGIEAEQLARIWKAAEEHGNDKIAPLLKAYNVEKSTHLTKEEAEKLLRSLDRLPALPVRCTQTGAETNGAETLPV